MIDERKILDAVRRASAEALLDTSLVVSKLIRAELSKPGTGMIYRIGKGRKNARNLRAAGFHRASAAGHPPAANTGRLRQSWALGGVVSGSDSIAELRYQRWPRAMRLVYGSNLRYAPMLEWGTNRMRPRPYARPVVKAVTPRVPRIAAAAFKRVLR